MSLKTVENLMVNVIKQEKRELKNLFDHVKNYDTEALGQLIQKIDEQCDNSNANDDILTMELNTLYLIKIKNLLQKTQDFLYTTEPKVIDRTQSSNVGLNFFSNANRALQKFFALLEQTRSDVASLQQAGQKIKHRELKNAYAYAQFCIANRKKFLEQAQIEDSNKPLANKTISAELLATFEAASKKVKSGMLG